MSAVALLTVLALIHSLEMEEKWITRPPYFRKFPSSVYITMSSSPEQFCTGTLLSPLWVLTAARCMFKDSKGQVVENDTSITVHAGVDNRTDLSGKNVQTRHSIKLLFYQTSYHSLALIKLDAKVETVSDVVESATVTSYCIEDVEDSICTSGSYGFYAKGMNFMQLDTRTCLCHKELKENYPNEPEDKWICGQYISDLEKNPIGIKLCKGDFGVGVMCDGNVQAVAVEHGIVQDKAPCHLIYDNKTECGDTYTKGLYVDICYYNEWLTELIPSLVKATTPKPRSAATLISPTLRWQICGGLLVFLWICKNK